MGTGVHFRRSSPGEPFIAAKHLYLDMATPLPATLGALRTSEYTPARLARSVKDELRENLIARLRDSAKATARRKPIHSFPASSATKTPSSPRSSTPCSRAKLHPAGPARPGEEPHPARAHHTARSALRPTSPAPKFATTPTRPSPSTRAT